MSGKKEIKLFERKWGREKTLKKARGYCSTYILFLVVAFYAALGVKDLLKSVAVLLVLLLFEAVYGCYVVLSLRLRKLEEEKEEREERLMR